MGQLLHGSATTTHAIRAAIQRSKASIQSEPMAAFLAALRRQLPQGGRFRVNEHGRPE